MKFQGVKYVIVGSGFFGSVIAERIANDLNEKVLVLEQRDHIGGNSFSKVDKETGIEVHQYGSHIFHTSSLKVWKYINQFTEFNNYRHKVLALYKNRIYAMPINLKTINDFYGINLSPSEAKEFLTKEATKENILNPSNLEEKAISLIGRPLYEAFIKGYTIKQWGKNVQDLPASIINRLPVNFNFDNWYFDDPYQGIPLHGYGATFEKILKNPNIEVLLNTDYFQMRDLLPKDALVIYSGPIDKFFDYKYGVLGWRTLSFEREVRNLEDFQGTSVMNYSEEQIPFTRIHEFKHYHPERSVMKSNKTVLFKEFSHLAGKNVNPFYPINTIQDREKYALYVQETANCKNVVFGGRLGGYKYLNMDQVIGMALETYEKIKARTWKN